MFVLRPRLHLSFAFLVAHFFGHLVHLLVFPSSPMPFKNTRFFHNVFVISQCL
jgi:hypothetical protein